ncbi:hypothetical protein BCIN_05g04320 [Botrytis cinerea B05.10]|uniref:Dna-directed rna polymerase ii subunit rpb1 protein n=2 Tax=Botryotinia fuckeliana TaxID=40559 RepID=A0A384JHX4_BOTFB|nr:hypothetical protein BCIN_05g04320 [Botrytis cinerea B05.10]ATZ50042.1 hypothetical protein BCIN_05g04320 [Botrytis cinerea B05.10]EMR80372.1 putative dna-directed rna polymerase ii subunit rpb1 protein [Botrytis cinerea BcDW1]
MNAHALLTSQGWRGTGHSLHHSSDTIGLSRPLLVSKKDNLLGVGKKMHKTADMWWLNAFDASLKGLDTSKEGQVKVQEGGGLEMVVKGGSKWVGGKGGLYSFFVRGETVGGTIEDREKEKKVTEIIVKEEKSGKGKDKKRKGEDRKESKEERRARKEKKRADRARKSAAKEAKKIKGGKEAKTPSASSTDSEKTETKEERRERKEQKRQKKLLRQSEKELSDTSSTSEIAKKKSRKNK